MLVNIKINGFEYREDSSLTILAVAKKHGIRIPTLCYLKKEEANFEHKPASCRVCVVEVKGRRTLVPACATYITEGMEVFTNTPRVRKERKTIVELLLSNHPNDCLACEKSGYCKLQDLAIELGIKRINSDGQLSHPNELITTGAIIRNPSKCILCSRCIDVCEKIQSVGAISASQRGFATLISEPHNCVNCGQCVQVCPTGALLQVDDTYRVEEALSDPEKYVVIQTAPSVRVSLGEPFSLPPGTDVTGKMITALRMLGFKKVFDTNFGADLTIMEETAELLQRVSENKNLPLITSCCPGWVKFIETQYPELINLPSSCKSPQEMLSAVIKTYYAEKEGIDPSKIVVVSLMPCIAKKSEANREEMKVRGLQPTDYSLSVKEVANMLKRYGIDLATCDEGSFDAPLGESTGAADIFGNTGGVMEAAVRTACILTTHEFPHDIEFYGMPGYTNTRHAFVDLGGKQLHLCVVSGLANARVILEEIKAGKANYDAIEVMACPGGCINGGGQPLHKVTPHLNVITARKKGLQAIDSKKQIRISSENTSIKKLYEEYLEKPSSHVAHELLHRIYKPEE